MRKNLHVKLVLILVLLIVSLMVVVGAFLMNSVTGYYLDEFYSQIADAFGPDNVKVSVTATVDVSERVVESTTYHQPDGSTENGGLTGHEMGYFALTRDGYQLVGGVPGTTSNSDLPTYVEDVAQDTQDGDGVVSSWENDHKIDETKEQVRVAPSVVDLSVAVTINANADSAANVDVAQLQHHIAVGANIGGDDPDSKVSVMLIPFPEEPEPEVRAGLIPQEYVPYVLIGLAVAVMAVLVAVRSWREDVPP